MLKGRNKLKKHVHAAREWLGEAEQSLDNEENVKGDLSVMLAKAELQHAAETSDESLIVVLAKKLIPLLLAAILAGGLYYYINIPEEVPAAPIPAKTEKPIERIDKPVSAEDVRQAEIIIVTEQREKESERVAEPQVPSEDMQKLMSTAGKSLRAQ